MEREVFPSHEVRAVTDDFVAIKLNVDLWGVKRYWRVSLIPDLDATGTDTFQLGFGVAAIGESAPLTT